MAGHSKLNLEFKLFFVFLLALSLIYSSGCGGEDATISSGVTPAIPGEVKPDLAISLTAVADDGFANVTFSYTISNLGTEAVDGVSLQLDLWGHAPAAPLVGDTGEVSLTISPLIPAGGEFSGNHTATGVSLSGTAYAAIDSTNLVLESNEDNNVSTPFAWPDPKPELSIALNAVNDDGSGNVTFNYTITNNGNADVNGDTIGLDFWGHAASAPAIGTTGEVSSTITQVIAASGGTYNGSFTAAGATIAGTAYAIVDTGNLIAEPNEGNNVSTGFNWAGIKPDLGIALTGVNDDGFGNVTFNYTVTNYGTFASNGVSIRLDFWGHAAAAPTIGTVGQANTTIAPTIVAAGGTYSSTFTITGVTVGGTAYAIADTFNTIAEVNESNNVSSGFGWVGIKADLSIALTSVINDMAGNVTFYYSITNSGTFQSNGVSIRLDFWGHAAAVPDIGTNGQTSTTIAPNIASGGGVFSDKFTAAGPTIGGMAFATVDTTNLLGEQNESNNVSAGLLWTPSLIASNYLGYVPALNWINPAMGGGYTGSLIVRSYSPINWVPTNGSTYPMFTQPVAGVEVIYDNSGDHSSVSVYDNAVDIGKTLIYYKVFHYDGAIAYAESAAKSLTYSYAPSSTIANGDFLLGRNTPMGSPFLLPGWTVTLIAGVWENNAVYGHFRDDAPPLHGLVVFYGNNSGVGSAEYTMTQTITIPAGATTLEVKGSDTNYDTEAFMTANTFQIEFDGFPYYLHSPTNAYNFVNKADISVLAGTTVTLTIHRTNSNAGYMRGLLDSVRIY